MTRLSPKTEKLLQRVRESLVDQDLKSQIIGEIRRLQNALNVAYSRIDGGNGPVSLDDIARDLQKRARDLPLNHQYRLACFIAENVGYVLKKEES